MDINRLQEKMKTRLMNSGAGLVGIADISALPIGDHDKLKTAILIGLPYDAGIISRLDTEVDAFTQHLKETRDRMENLLKVCEDYLRGEGFLTLIKFVEILPDFVSTFSYKMAGTKAGLGWVGKSSLFVSPEFGCCVRLEAVLTNAPLTPGEPVVESQCGDCKACVKACPNEAIRGANWYPGIERDKLLDAFLCFKRREEYIPKLGYIHPCGRCMKACPVGKRKA